MLQDANARAVLTTDEHMSRMAPLAEEAGAKILCVSDPSDQLSRVQAGSLQRTHLGHCSVMCECIWLADMCEHFSLRSDQTYREFDRLTESTLICRMHSMPWSQSKAP